VNWKERFNALAERKELQAREAHIAPFQTLEDHSGDAPVERIGNRWTHDRFNGSFYASRRDDRRSMNLVFVQSREGNTGAKDPGALGGGNADKYLIYEGLSRVHVDAVMAGAHTVLDGDVLFSVWHPELVALRQSLGKPRHPIQVVVSSKNAAVIREQLLFNVADVEAILITTDTLAQVEETMSAERPWVHVIGTGPRIDLRRAIDAMAREHGIQSISCVGGRTTAAALIAGDLVDDLYLTTSPLSGGDPGTPLDQPARRKRLVVRKEGTGSDAGVLFEHWKLR
jgi:riboflavin biosynthesis pyrimidine reductase